MKRGFFSKLFIAIALLTSASIVAQATDTVNLHDYEKVKIVYSLKQDKMQDSGDIESLRERVEVNRAELEEMNTDRRLSDRQFRIHHKKNRFFH
ncbi:hypothetical protein AB7W88_15700 [Providencia vermicola]|uniref:Uncharacterized protein n=2 Tax=Providencia TaxID=586 RepID=A0AAI9I332_PROST|nr:MULTISPECIES: hypothetical protein [Providencia]ELR5044641.1 hypothetical protein [Providencia rettgeri]ELR5037339.1 hypothetical protein [Providencia stuartii]ELR5120337.1 hypothetical protein [Providencia stuartii]ELR5143297.1 hypothetical protein [Providencia stuartii]ELR5292061.1 hypothetical protein [Providencia stuartii]